MQAACPVHTSAQGYVALVAQGRFEEAYKVAGERNPFPSVCGRICTHLCETECTRGEVDAPVAVAALKRFVADTVGPLQAVAPVPVAYEDRVAVIGAGPAGMTCARDLADMGYGVVVYEAQQVAGGMLRLGIPDYRLPHDVLTRKIDQILARGVELKLGQRAGIDFTVDQLFEQGYRAVYLATGLEERERGAARRRPHRSDGSRRAPARGQHRRHAAGRRQDRGHRRRRRGAGRPRQPIIRLQTQAGLEPDVTLAYRRSEVEMPASAGELQEARDEGLKLELLAQPDAILGAGGKVTGMRLRRCELGDPDASGRRLSVPVPGI